MYNIYFLVVSIISYTIILIGHEYTWLNVKFINSLYEDSTEHGNIEIRVCKHWYFGYNGCRLVFLYVE